MQIFTSVLTALIAACVWPCAHADYDDQLGRIEVVEPAPLPGLGVPTDQVPADVQSSSGDALRNSHAGNLSDYLDDSFAGITLNQTQDNPFQADLLYHGFEASPLLGAPEGLSVYVDGVRVNEASGDTVNWDLIPDSAIQQVSLMPGSNPVFGLNTLGGALVITTRDGRDSPGYETQASVGSYGGRDAEGSAGGAAGKLDGFISAHYYQDDGWRQDSPSRLSQVFAKLGWRDERGRLDLSYTGADTALIGDGAAPDSLLARDYTAVYTTPDATRNRLDFLNLTGFRSIDDSVYLSGDVYYRHLVTHSENGDENDEDYRDADAGIGPDCGGGATDAVTLAFCSPGVDRRSVLKQRSYGTGIQATRGMGAGADDQAVAGLSWDGSRDGYAQAIQYGDLTADRAFLAGATPPQGIAAINGTTATLGAYLMDTYSPASWLHVTASARWDQERLTFGGDSVDTDLDDVGTGFGATRPVTGDHRFHTLNPALGFTTAPLSGVSFYGDYNEGMRAPTVVELGCADPRAPCGLPDDFASDPALRPVVARTLELGVRSTAPAPLQWSVDVFRTRNSDDIQFISASSSPSAGYFANVGDTLREGMDLRVQGQAGALRWQASASLLRARFESTFIEGNADANSSSNPDGQIMVRPGDPLPLTPERTGRISADYALTGRWRIGGQLLYISGSMLRGNENGLDQAGAVSGDGQAVEGSGRIGGYALMGLRSSFQWTGALSVFMRIDNLLDRRYATAGFLTDDAFRSDGGFRADGSSTHEDSVAPGAPRMVWVGMELQWR